MARITLVSADYAVVQKCGLVIGELYKSQDQLQWQAFAGPDLVATKNTLSQAISALIERRLILPHDTDH